MGSTVIEYRLLPGTAASVGRSSGHSVIADRPHGIAGGLGLGFNGGELLALAIGGCFCNDIQAIAREMGHTVDDLKITVTVDFGGTPSRAIGARMDVDCALADGADSAALIAEARARTTIANSLRAGVPVAITATV